MKDIDFDELDRAVNSLINPAATAAPAEPASSVPVSSTPAPAPIAPLAERRSSGRFMDVVHPSSDMRGSVPARSTQPESVKQSDVTSSLQTPSVSTMPDPIDVAESTNVSKDVTEPLESPFLADAKVEKRPLGAFSGDIHDSALSMSPSASPATTGPDLESLSLDSPLEDTSTSSDHPIENETPMPAELQTDLLSIEANEDTTANKTEEMAPAPVVEAAPVGPTSITPQYTQQPSTGDKPAGNIFDTQAYKKPQAAKGKKSGLLVVLWIFLLLVIGAGIGAAVYFFVLPRL